MKGTLNFFVVVGSRTCILHLPRGISVELLYIFNTCGLRLIHRSYLVPFSSLFLRTLQVAPVSIWNSVDLPPLICILTKSRGACVAGSCSCTAEMVSAGCSSTVDIESPESLELSSDTPCTGALRGFLFCIHTLAK